MNESALLIADAENDELPPAESVELDVSIPPQANRHDGERPPLPVKLLIAYEVDEREERWEVRSFPLVGEGVAAAEAMVDSFLLRHHKAQLRGRQLYDHFVKYGPDVYVDASIEEPVFFGWEYARRRVRQICGVW